MQNYRDLKLLGSNSEQDKAIHFIEENLCDGWQRDREKEDEFWKSGRIKYRIFIRSKTDSLPTVALFLTRDNNGYFYVCNIVPKEISELGVKGYNQIIEEFLMKIVRPSVQKLDIRIVTNEGIATIDNSMSPELAEKLRVFVYTANKSTAGTHPCDQRRFQDFIIQSHLEGSLLDEYTLKSLLVDEDWSEDNAYLLSSQYQFGREILKRFTET